MGKPVLVDATFLVALWPQNDQMVEFQQPEMKLYQRLVGPARTRRADLELEIAGLNGLSCQKGFCGSRNR